MPVVNTKTTAIQNADANPRILNNANVTKGRLRSCVGSVEVAAGDDDGSVFRLARVPSNAVIHQLIRKNDAITGATDYDLGVYQTADNGGAVVNVNLFADAIDISAGTLLGVDHRYDAGADADLADCHKELWQLLGLSADPNCDYDIAWTGVTVGSGAGTLSLLTVWAE